MRKIKFFPNLITALLSITTILTFTTDLSTNEVDASTVVIRWLAEFRESLHGFNIVWLVFLIILFRIYKKVFFVEISLRKRYISIPAVFFALCMILGYSYSRTASWDLVFGSRFQICKSVILFTGYFSLFYVCIFYIFTFLQKDEKLTKINGSNRKIDFLLNKHLILFSWIFIFIAWLPWLIALYPAIIPWDTMDQIYQAAGIFQLTNHHPVFITWILGLFRNLGKSIGSENVGIFLLTFFQSVFFSGVLAFSLSFMKQLSKSVWLRFFPLLFYAFIPYYPCNSVTLGKDTTYSIFLLLFGFLYLRALIGGERRKNRILTLAGICIAVLFCVLSRKNGIFVILPSLIGLLFFSDYRKRTVILITLVTILGYFGFDRIVLPSLNIPPGKIQDVFSVPFQQTARYIKMYPNEITDLEKNSINRILRYDEIAGRYNPEISDPVKDLFRQEADSEDFEVYFHVWRQMFQKHPAVYLQATLNNTYGYFYPDEPGKSEDFVFWGIKIPMESDLVQITNPRALDDARSTLFQLIYTFRVFPGISMFGSIGFHVWILILAFMFLLSIRQYRFITVLLPSIFSLFVCLVSPINTYSRYAWPIIFLTPLVVYVCFYAQKSLRINTGH